MSKLKIYGEPLFKGKVTDFDKDDFDLSIITDISKVGSIEISPGYLALACLEPNFNSPAFIISNLWTNESSFGKKRNVEIKSLKLIKNRSVTIFEHQNFAGESAVLEFPIANLSSINFNDRISSILCGGITCSCYTDEAFSGAGPLFVSSFWNTPSATDYWNDSISSVFVNL